MWIWNRTANRETNRKHRNRTGTVHIHEPNQTGGEPNRLGANRKHEPVANRLKTEGICLFSIHSSTGKEPEFVRWCSLPHLHVQKSIWLLKRKEGKTERADSNGLDILGLASKIKARHGIASMSGPFNFKVRVQLGKLHTPREHRLLFPRPGKSKSAYMGICF